MGCEKRSLFSWAHVLGARLADLARTAPRSPHQIWKQTLTSSRAPRALLGEGATLQPNAIGIPQVG